MQMIETALLKGSSFVNHCCSCQRAHSSALTLWVSSLCGPCSWQCGHWDIMLLPSRGLNAMGGVHEAQSCSETAERSPAETSAWPLHTDIVWCVSIYSSKYPSCFISKILLTEQTFSNYWIQKPAHSQGPQPNMPPAVELQAPTYVS